MLLYYNKCSTKKLKLDENVGNNNAYMKSVIKGIRMIKPKIIDPGKIQRKPKFIVILKKLLTFNSKGGDKAKPKLNII